MLVIRVLLYLLGVGALVSSAFVLRWPGAQQAPLGAATAHEQTMAAVPLTADSMAILQDRDPFRRERVPAAIAYDPVQKAEAEAPVQPPAPKPVLSLSGILLGGEPSAVIEGIPGVEGPRLVRPGDSLGGVRIKRIRKDGVEIRGYDTTWVLTVRSPW